MQNSMEQKQNRFQKEWNRTNTKYPVSTQDAGFHEYAYRKKFHINLEGKKKVLVAGAGSYIGEAFEQWAFSRYSGQFHIDTVDMRDDRWRRKDFREYDCVFHVAGIAHADVRKADASVKAQYYAVNTKLAVETARKAKKEKVGQFIFMSSIIIYGDAARCGRKGCIDEHTVPRPANFYGDSKWQADKKIRSLGDEEFHVAVLRPPMIYGRGSKGNYPVLAKLAKKFPIFPDVDNRRSMLHIDNLCEFLCKLILSGEGGIYFPQNAEYTRTSLMAKEIASVSGKKMVLVKFLRPAVFLASCIPGRISAVVKKAFGNMVYNQNLSVYEGLEYRVNTLKESIQLTEGERGTEKPHILVVSQYFYPESFRINDMVVEWIKRGYKVTVLTGIPNYPEGKFYEGYGYTHRRRERWNGADIIRIPLIPRGKTSIGLAANYLSFVVSGYLWVRMHPIHADKVFTYEVSPMTQGLVGVWYAKRHHVSHYIYVTDLWPENVEYLTGIHHKAVIAPLQKMADYIYHNSEKILTCSEGFIEPIKKRGVKESKIEFWPQYAEDFYRPVEKNAELGILQDGIFNMVFAGNVGQAQGLGILVDGARQLKEEGLKARFHIVGDGRYLAKLKEQIRDAQVSSYFHFIPRKPAQEVAAYLALADAVLITLSKSNVFAITIPAKTQSCMACGRPILVSADGEIQRIVRDAGAGLCSDAEDSQALTENIKIMMNMEREEREAYGRRALQYSQRHFNKNMLLNRLDELLQGEKS